MKMRRFAEGTSSVASGQRTCPTGLFRPGSNSVQRNCAESLGTHRNGQRPKGTFAIAADLVATIAWGRRRRITMEEVERLERQGFGGKKRGTRRANQAAASAKTARLTHAQARSKP
jgi:hypothetical protein